MRATAEDYRQQLRDLLPQGPAWGTETGSLFGNLLYGLASELSRVHNRTLALVRESDPRTTLELLPDYERTAGLPEPCIEPPKTFIERRNALVEKLTRLGGQSPPYFIAVAARLGFPITITEFSRHTVRSMVNVPINGQPWNFAWEVTAPEETVQPSTVQSAVNDPLADWGNAQLECVLERLKPAHTHVRFRYLAWDRAPLLGESQLPKTSTEYARAKITTGTGSSTFFSRRSGPDIGTVEPGSDIILADGITVDRIRYNSTPGAQWKLLINVSRIAGSLDFSAWVSGKRFRFANEAGEVAEMLGDSVQGKGGQFVRWDQARITNSQILDAFRTQGTVFYLVVDDA